MKLCLTFEEYQNMLDSTSLKEVINKLVQDNLQGKLSDFLEQEMKKPGQTIDNMPLMVRPISDIFPVQASAVRNSKYCKVITASYDSWINAFQSMQDPKHFAQVINLINKKLGKENGDEYELGDPEFHMLGLANRYAENAEKCKILYKWKDFNFYMSMLAYFLPFLVEQAGLNDADLAFAIEAKAKKAKKQVKSDAPAGLTEMMDKARSSGNDVLMNRLEKLKNHFDKQQVQSSATKISQTDKQISYQITCGGQGVGYKVMIDCSTNPSTIMVMSSYNGVDARMPVWKGSVKEIDADNPEMIEILDKLAQKHAKELNAVLASYGFKKVK